MEYLGLIVSWMKDVIRNFPASASEPDVWGAILAIFLLLVLLSVASSQRRIKREIAAISSELSSIRSTLRKIDMAVGRMELGQLEGGEEEKDIWKLAFRLDDDKPKRE